MNRTIDWRIDVLRNNVAIGTLKANQCELIFDSSAQVMRSGKITMPINPTTAEGVEINLFSDRIRPAMLKDGQEYPLGKYMVVAAPESLSDAGSFMSIEMYDETMILKQARIDERVFFASGTSYQSAIEQILVSCGLTSYFFEDTAATLSEDREFPIGTMCLEIINKLLDEINYDHIHAGLDGVLYLTPKRQKQSADHVYTDRRPFGILKPIKRDTDIYSLPNVLIGVVSNPSLASPIVYKRENNDLNSQISIPARGYKVTKTYNLSNIATAEDLQAYIDAEFLKSTQMTETAEIETVPEAGHEFGDTVQIDTELISGLYVEVGWTMRLSVTENMTHKLERMVFV